MIREGRFCDDNEHVVCVVDDVVLFFCKGCGAQHGMKISGDDPWFFDNDFHKPTILPSLVLSRVNEQGNTVIYCHVTIIGGVARYYNNSEHKLKGKDIPLESW